MRGKRKKNPLALATWLRRSDARGRQTWRDVEGERPFVATDEEPSRPGTIAAPI
jgi:hypothetical protein